MKLVIAEKPSVAMEIGRVLGATNRADGYIENEEYIISWCIGHLIGLSEAAAYDEKFKRWQYQDLPIIPEKWQYKIQENTKKQYYVLKKLLLTKEVDEVIAATDAGREGELIFRLVYQMSGSKKPIKRLWISSLEETAIRDGFMNLKPGETFENLYESASCRAKADWLIGINATRLFSILSGEKLSVGRVQTPTLAMLVEREYRVKNFIKDKFFHAHIDCEGVDAQSERIEEEKVAREISKKCDGKKAIIKALEKTIKTASPPKLYDLTTLQREANRIFGYTAKETLDYAQSLYEKKYVTYPRTDSQYLTEDMLPKISDILAICIKNYPFAEGLNLSSLDPSQVIKNDKVNDHHAIIPTMTFSEKDDKTLKEEEKKILELIIYKLLSAVGEKYRYEAVKMEFLCEENIFTAKGKKVLEMGFKETEEAFKYCVKSLEKETENKERELPSFVEGQVFESVKSKVTEHFTSPPKPYTEDTLLSAMETAGNESFDEDSEKKGLGTPATRAGIIEKLINILVIERKGKQLRATEKGMNLIKIIPEELKSPKLTAEWENKLTQIAKGELEGAVFTKEIEAATKALIEENKSINPEFAGLFKGQREKESLGKCPRCKSNIYEGKTNFYCSNRDCQFVLWKNNKFFENKKKELTKDIVKTLLECGKIKMTGLYSEKKDKKYNATIVMNDTGDKYVNFELQFGSEKKKRIN